MTDARESADHVSVHLTDCGHQDAGAVFGVLEAAFPEAGPPRSETSPGAPGAGPMIWCMTVDTRTRLGEGAAQPGKAPLSGTVTADLFGAADPVRQVKEELERAFDAEHRGHVSGEHEMELRLKLATRTAS
ncbi:hypothetical protein B7P34_20385 [Streptosporangium nondiastaticum]|uniref:Uncharacterized protein n=2 Tax=Actinomycetes TaxID=1760 RepID=A0A9X7JN92_9ACTN|nr:MULTISPECIES: hypothetical protein [Actinomycetes]PSJ26885.1 hypothetical protein B7P34_20385 [Streptosporangium nondiastaticum]WKU43430.1 hypothetical protein Q3V23_04655 [Streptomyces sp. VNUA116]